MFARMPGKMHIISNTWCRQLAAIIINSPLYTIARDTHPCSTTHSHIQDTIKAHNASRGCDIYVVYVGGSLVVVRVLSRALHHTIKIMANWISRNYGWLSRRAHRVRCSRMISEQHTGIHHMRSTPGMPRPPISLPFCTKNRDEISVIKVKRCAQCARRDACDGALGFYGRRAARYDNGVSSVYIYNSINTQMACRVAHHHSGCLVEGEWQFFCVPFRSWKHIYQPTYSIPSVSFGHCVHTARAPARIGFAVDDMLVGRYFALII